MRYLSLFAVVILFLPASVLVAAQKQLSSNDVPPPVAFSKIAPLGRLPGTNQLRLAIGLPLRDAEGLTNLLREIYDPASPQFHHYLSPAEFTERFGPTPADYAAVMHFAQTNGLTILHQHPNRLVLDVTGRVGDVERAFQVRLHSYRHPKENRNFYAPDSEPLVDATLPILHVSGLDNYSLPKPQSHLQPAVATRQTAPLFGTGPNGAYWGNDFRQAYVPGSPLTGAGQSIGLLQFDGFYPVDITNYANAIGLSNMPPVVIVPVDGGVTSVGDGEIEVALDIEMSMAMAPGVSTIYVYEGDILTVPWVDILSQMANDNRSRQLSSSWGGGGADPTSEEVFRQMAAQGQTFFNASGDSNAFTGAINFPSESPNITIVGGTTLTTDDSGNYFSETVWNRNNGNGSGGGISPEVPIPSWQLGLDLTAAQGSASMRNLPDVAFTAENIFIYHNDGGSDYVGGTSCAAPLWAAYTALINQQAIQLGQPSVGFLNPAIYALNRGTNYALTFHDITVGDNTSLASPTNFYAVPGFDLCTGWGTPNGTNLINALTTPDFLGVSPSAFSVSGLVGGSLFQTNWTFTLTNSGPANLGWALGVLPVWLGASATNGTLSANGATNIHLQLKPGLLPLPPAGSYVNGLEVTNLSLDRVETIAFTRYLGQSVVSNGGFETGDFTGWTLVGDTVIGPTTYNIVIPNNYYVGISDVAYSGNFGAFLGEGGKLASLSQTLSTVVGQKYQLSFWLDNPQSGSVQQFSANWAGTNLLNLVNPPVFTWTNYQFMITASGTNTVLEFLEENDPNYFGFDEVTATPVPPVISGNVSAGSGSLQFNWYALAGLNYQVQFATNLAAPNWQNLSTVITATTNIAGLTDTNVFNAARQRFYRVKLLLSP